MTVAYTDGACSGNPGPGGWAWAVPGGAYASGCEAHSTNQRMEIMAAWDAVRSIEGPLEIVSDSTYVVKCFNDEWWKGWLKRGWTNSAKKPVANRDLWEPFIELVRDRGDVTFRWVKGHSGDEMNDLVDRLAVEAATTQRGREGDEPPTELGPADDVSSFGARAAGSTTSSGPGSSGVDSSGLDEAEGDEVVARDGSPLPGHPLVVFGHKPTELGGYDENFTTADVRRQLAEIIAAKRIMHDDLVVVSGLGLGAETLAAEAAIEAEVPFVAVLPFPAPDKVWPSASRARFRALTEQALDVIALQRREPDSRQKAGAALAKRDAWLIANAREVVLVWDGKDPALAKLHKAAEATLAEDIWVLAPKSF